MADQRKPVAWLLEESDCWPATITFNLAKMETVKAGLVGLGPKVVVPLVRAPSWDDAEAVAEEMRVALPREITAGKLDAWANRITAALHPYQEGRES